MRTVILVSACLAMLGAPSAFAQATGEAGAPAVAPRLLDSVPAAVSSVTLSQPWPWPIPSSGPR